MHQYNSLSCFVRYEKFFVLLCLTVAWRNSFKRKWLALSYPLTACFRDGSMAGRSIANNTSVIEDRGGSRRVVMNRGSTRSSVTLRQGDMNDEKTTVVLLEQVMPDGNNHGLQRNRSSRRLANKFLLHYKGVLGGGANMQTHIWDSVGESGYSWQLRHSRGHALNVNGSNFPRTFIFLKPMIYFCEYFLSSLITVTIVVNGALMIWGCKDTYFYFNVFVLDVEF